MIRRRSATVPSPLPQAADASRQRKRRPAAKRGGGDTSGQDAGGGVYDCDLCDETFGSRVSLHSTYCPGVDAGHTTQTCTTQTYTDVHSSTYCRGWPKTGFCLVVLLGCGSGIQDPKSVDDGGK